MLGTGNGHEWPRHGEIDIVEAVNGDPRVNKEIIYDLAMMLCSSNQIVMTVHSTNHNGGNGQHPSENPYNLNADLTQDPLIAGFEWNIRPDVGQVVEIFFMISYKHTNNLFF